MLENFLKYIISKNIIYIKIFQWIDTKNLLPTFITEYINKLNNNAPYINADIDFECLEKLKTDIDINLTPINSGTISLVFLGKLKKNNDLVAIKILRLNIKDKINLAFKRIKYFSYFLYLEYFNDWILNIEKTFLEQIDIQKEKINISLIHSKLKTLKFCETIKLYEDFNFDNCIVMSYIDGKTFYELSKEDIPGFLRSYTQMSIFLTFTKKIMHLDLHVGNILFVKKGENYKIALLDLSMILFLSENEKDFLYEFYTCLASKNINNIIKCIEKHKNSIFENIKEELFEKFIKELLSYTIFEKFESYSLIKDINLVLNISSKFKLKFNNSINNMILGLISNLSLVGMLDPDSKTLSEFGMK